MVCCEKVKTNIQEMVYLCLKAGCDIGPTVRDLYDPKGCVTGRHAGPVASADGSWEQGRKWAILLYWSTTVKMVIYHEIHCNVGPGF